jgi:hypothetical protein
VPVLPAFFNSINVNKILLFCIILLIGNNISAIEISADLFTYDEAKVEKDFEQLNKLEAFLKANPEILSAENELEFPSINNNINSSHNSIFGSTEIMAPGKIPSFWFTFTFSAIGTYTIYGAVAGPISVGIVYFSSKKDKIERNKAIWGCVAGTLIGAGIKYAVVKL